MNTHLTSVGLKEQTQASGEPLMDFLRAIQQAELMWSLEHGLAHIQRP
jgi:hypothetical protein